VSRGACGAWRLKVKSQLDNLGRVRDFVSGQVLPDDLPGDGAGEFLLAVDEAVSNVMMHGAPSGDADIEVQFTRDPAALSVFIRDDAPLYDPTRVEEPVQSPLFGKNGRRTAAGSWLDRQFLGPGRSPV
jgi:anti-sigma regulatory factor (Ser/Thr protein kinase)